ncbi:MAG TPA: TIM barrel protein [Solirubrobacteraceae bacterium]|nr:TIM barrel protein [Solirubrobacteraceae bacterium]
MEDRGLRTCIATVCLSGTLEDKLAAAAHAGFDGIELFEPDLIGSRLSPAEIRDAAAAQGLSIDLYQPLRDFEGVEDGQRARNLRRAEAKLDVMEQLGARTLLVCSNVSASALDDDARAADQLRALAERAGRRGMRVAYEALGWGTHVSTYDHAWRIVRDADHPALGTCLDSFHILSREAPLDAIAEIPSEKLFFVQLADAPHLVMDVLQWSRHYRCFPGQGGFDLADFTDRVLAAGYEGPLSLEVFNDVFRQADPERMAVDAMRSLLVLQERLRGAGRRPLPPPACLRGYAFVELAVEPTSAGKIQRLLHALGFAQAAQHRTKPVTMWQQRDLRVLLNAGASSPPGITALAVESEDPERSSRRAELLLAPILARQHAPDEADLAAVAAPDGTSVFFCSSDERPEARGWLQDFEPLAVGDRRDARLEAIDHVALAQPFDYFDEAVLFYRSVLDLEPGGSLELSAPTGLVRSRAMSSANGSVRLALNVPVLGGGMDATAGHQHVAFACADVLGVAARLLEAGFSPLAIPANYYEDLSARFDLAPELVRCMRELSVLYDGDAHGEFLHFYTPTIGGRLFFEVVERRGAYDGYAAANAPIRMAAQRAAQADGGRAAAPVTAGAA